jgi:hypothetical protein
MSRPVIDCDLALIWRDLKVLDRRKVTPCACVVFRVPSGTLGVVVWLWPSARPVSGLSLWCTRTRCAQRLTFSVHTSAFFEAIVGHISRYTKPKQTPTRHKASAYLKFISMCLFGALQRVHQACPRHTIGRCCEHFISHLPDLDAFGKTPVSQFARRRASARR